MRGGDGGVRVRVLGVGCGVWGAGCRLQSIGLTFEVLGLSIWGYALRYLRVVGLGLFECFML